jgi:hypothetical protein
LATLGGDGHSVNDTMPAYGQLLVVGFGIRTFPNYRTRVHSTQEASTGTYSQPRLPPETRRA